MNNVFLVPIAILVMLSRAPVPIGLASIGTMANINFLWASSKNGKTKALLLNRAFARRSDQSNAVVVSSIKKIDNPMYSVNSLDFTTVQFSSRSDVCWKGGMKVLGNSAVSFGNFFCQPLRRRDISIKRQCQRLK